MSDINITTRSRKRVEVQTLSEDTVSLIHEREQSLYVKARDKYLAEFTFTEANDLRSLDRLLLLEVQNFRWQWFLAANSDYWGTDLTPQEESTLHKAVKDIQSQISDIQRDLGLTKSQRDKDSEDSVDGYLKKLRLAAREHGVRREKQLGRAIELVNELVAVVGAFERASEHERRKLGFETSDDIIQWISEYLAPEFDAIDQYFRKHQQRFWVRDL